MKKFLTGLRQLFAPPMLTKGHPDLRGSFTSIDGSAEERAHRHNEVEIAIANFEVQKEAMQKTLFLAYASFITSVFASVVAVGALVVAILALRK